METNICVIQPKRTTRILAYPRLPLATKKQQS